MSVSKSKYQTHVLKYSVLHNLQKGKKVIKGGARFHFQYPDSLITACLPLPPSTIGYAKSLKNKKHGKCRDTTRKLFARQTARTVRVKMCRLQMSSASPAVVFASVLFLFIFAQVLCRKVCDRQYIVTSHLRNKKINLPNTERRENVYCTRISTSTYPHPDIQTPLNRYRNLTMAIIGRNMYEG